MKCPGTPRAFTLVEILIVAAFIALLAALAIPAFLRVSHRSQTHAVGNNARQLGAALEIYYLENGTTTVQFSELLGSTRYLKDFRPIAGESYPASFTQGQSFTITGIGGNRSLTYQP